MNFNPDMIDWSDWKNMLIQYVSDITHEQYKKTFLLNKLPTHVQQTVTNYQSFEDCLDSLRAQYGDPVRAMKRRITQFVNYCQEPTTSMDNIEQIAKDVAKIQGLTARLANVRDLACKCPLTDRKACN